MIFEEKRLSFAKKATTLFRTVKYVYKTDPLAAIVRDIAFVIITALDMYMIKVGGQFIDATARLLLDWTEFNVRDYFYTESFQFLMIVLAGWIVVASLNNLRKFLEERMNRNVELRAKTEILEKISNENLQEVEERRFQELVTFVPNYAISRIYKTYNNFSEVLRHSLAFVSAFLILSQTMSWTVLFLLIISLPEPIVEMIGDNKLRNIRQGEVRGIKFVNYLMNIGIRVPFFAELKVDGIYSGIIRRYKKSQTKFFGRLKEQFKHNYIDKSFFAMIGQVLKYVYIVYILAFSVVQRFSFGQFKALYDYASKSYDSAYQIWRNLFSIFDRISYTQDFFELLDYEGFGDVSVGEEKISKGTPSLEFQKLDFKYPEDKHKVLENLSLKVMPGEKVAIIGGDGSGKTSLVKTLCGLFEIVAGDYVIDDKSIRELGRGELKDRISVIFQNFIRYNFTVQRNITLTGEKSRTNMALYEKVKKIAQVDIFMKEEGLSDDQVLGKYFSNGKQISPGYWQRIAIARMLYRDRDVFIMDEPFTYIDGPSRGKIMDDTFEFIGKDRTLIYITQNTDHLKRFDKVYLLQGGKIVEEGTLKELMTKKGKFYKEAKGNI